MPSAKLVIVGGTVDVMSVGADIGYLDREQASLDGTAQHTMPDGALEGLWKECQHMKSHRIKNKPGRLD